MLRIGVLASGSGTNFQALYDACASGYADAAVALVLTNTRDAPVLERGRAAAVQSVFVDPRSACSREEYDKQLRWHINEHGVELVCAAGFMRILSAEFVRTVQTLNVHPSLLPAFPGLNAIRQAWDHGVRVTGVTIHLMDEHLDAGPIVAQRSVDVPETFEELER